MKYYSIEELWGFIKNGKIFIIFSLVFCILLGLLIYKVTPNTYESSVSFVIPGNTDQSQSRLGGLASLTGLNLNSTPGIPVTAYEHIAMSAPLLAGVSVEKVLYLGDSVYVGNYISQKMNVSLKDRILGNYLKDNERLKPDDSILKEYTKNFNGYNSSSVETIELRGNLGISVNKLKKSISFESEINKPIKLLVTTEDPVISAMITKLILEKLEKFVSVYTKSNKEDNSAFLLEEFEKSRAELNNLRNLYAAAQDGTINANKARAKMGVERLSLEYSQALRSHNELKVQLDAALIQEEKRESYFVIIEQPRVLNIGFPTAPRLVIYVALSIFLGFFLSISILILKNVFANRFN